ncbi:MAG: DUF2189 domain-containing protein [Gammaproteobacteria bacterium]|nr:DUF2189 domain-containing protein [Gammaproteobacteria bacterium]NND37862.1 DUF2189 domain-containing protein [Gammaproteobacteria bacterium]
MADDQKNSSATAPNDTINRDELPFVAPCRDLEPLAPLGWVRDGISDFRKAPFQGLLIGVFSTVLIAIICALAWTYGSFWFLFAMLGGFVFLAPLACVGTYAISAQIERGEPVSTARMLRAAFKRYLSNELVFALVLLVIFLVWARAGSAISIFFPVESDYAIGDLVSYLTIGTTVGAIFTAITFSASAFSLPMIMHRDVDMITAVVTSINAVLRNKLAMFVWLSLILIGLVIGLATGFVGLIFVLPLIGFAAWHGYLDTIDASAFPRHEVGITATPRRGKTDLSGL